MLTQQRDTGSMRCRSLWLNSARPLRRLTGNRVGDWAVIGVSTDTEYQQHVGTNYAATRRLWP